MVLISDQPYFTLPTRTKKMFVPRQQYLETTKVKKKKLRISGSPPPISNEIVQHDLNAPTAEPEDAYKAHPPFLKMEKKTETLIFFLTDQPCLRKENKWEP